MIAFDLICAKGHAFEGWFDSSEAFEEQQGRGLVSCPVCGHEQVAKALSPVRALKAKGGDAPPAEKPNEAAQARAMMQTFKNFIDQNFDDVGIDFAKEALKIHYGASPQRNIRGSSTEQEDELLRQEGVEFFRLPMPKDLD